MKKKIVIFALLYMLTVILLSSCSLEPKLIGKWQYIGYQIGNDSTAESESILVYEMYTFNSDHTGKRYDKTVRFTDDIVWKLQGDKLYIDSDNFLYVEFRNNYLYVGAPNQFSDGTYSKDGIRWNIYKTAK